MGMRRRGNFWKNRAFPAKAHARERQNFAPHKFRLALDTLDVQFLLDAGALDVAILADRGIELENRHLAGGDEFHPGFGGAKHEIDVWVPPHDAVILPFADPIDHIAAVENA